VPNTPFRHRLLDNPVAATVLSVWGWLVLGVLLITWLPLVALVWAFTAPFDRGRYWPGWLFRKVTVVFGWLNPLWRFRTSGLKVHDPRRPYVVVANHESFADMFLISQLPWEMKWLGKADFFRYPVLGWLMRMAADIRLVRGNKDSIVAAMKSARDRLDKKVSVMIFPEGTRSRDGSLGKFKDGAFRLAIETGHPILPMAVHGTHEAIRKGDWRFGVTDAEVRVLEPISVEGLTLDDVDALRDRTRDLIAATVTDMGG
jgi:1-acyl-sn-glycerol-3-phosphate acyltransferase